MFAVAVDVAHAVALAVVDVAEAQLSAALESLRRTIECAILLGMKGVSFQHILKSLASLTNTAARALFVMTESACTRLVREAPNVSGRNKNRASRANAKSSNAGRASV